MSLHLYRNCSNIAARSTARGISRTSVRFLLSKKSDNTPEDPHAAAPPKKALAKIKKEKDVKEEQNTKTTSAGKKLVKRLTQKYMSFKDLPKPLQEFQNMSTEQFNALLNMSEIPEKGLPKHEPLMPISEFKYDFTLHPRHRLLSRRGLIGAGEKQYGAIEPNLALLGLNLDADTLSSGMEEHPLRESITGMCVMNPLLKEIKNKSLWEFFPATRKYGASPFGKDASFNAFKEWEDLKTAKFKVFEEKKQKEEKEFRDFCKNLQESNSFVRKTAAADAGKKIAPVTKDAKETLSEEKSVATSGRRKLDRSLLRQYRKYRKDQYLKDSKDDKDDE